MLLTGLQGQPSQLVLTKVKHGRLEKGGQGIVIQRIIDGPQGIQHDQYLNRLQIVSCAIIWYQRNLVLLKGS